MTERQVDLAIVGGGSAGYAAAIRARELGRSVVLIERDKVGGACLHRGCVPTKALLHVAETADAVREGPDIGVRASLEGIDGAAMQRFRAGIIEKKYAGLQSLLKAHDIEVIPASGRLLGGGRIQAGDEVVQAKDIVLATGAKTRTIPGVELGGRILSSEEAIFLEDVPSSVLVLGGGVIGSEFASLWRSLGAEVTILEALPRLVAGEDAGISRAFDRQLRRRGIAVRTDTKVAGARSRESDVVVELEDGTELTADYLLVAVGRAPVTEELGLEDAGVELDGGFVTTDERLRTSAAGVWAAGDIVRGLQLAHRGYQQGIFIAEEIEGLRPVVVDDVNVPRVTYSDPEIASMGLTQEQAEEAHGADRVRTVEYNLAGNARSEIVGARGFAKVVRVVDGPVVGVHMIGRRVGELIAEAQLVVGWEAHPEDIAPFIHTHPTQGEALGEAFLALAGKPLHTMP